MKNKLTSTTILHYVKLILRSILFLGALVLYILNFAISEEFAKYLYCFLVGIWILYVIEIFMRLFPSKMESPGCQKQFKQNYKPINTEQKPKLQSWKQTFIVFLSWIILNGIIGVLYFCGIINKEILILISLAYGVCDMICILFFCPFQTWFMKNRCCTTCRIYNWDFAMMFTPYFFVPHVYTWSLLGLALILLIRWEVGLKVHPERFATNTNAYISCANCTEKLCRHKKQLQNFLKKQKK
jgi:hypothetical protein